MNYIMGVGNYSMYDDSIGIRVVEFISFNNLDHEQNFRAIDLSSTSFNIFSYLNDETEKILIVDALKTSKDEGRNLKAGEYLFFEPHEIKSEKELSSFTTHEEDIVKVLELAKRSGYPIPSITFMGIGIEIIKEGFGLSHVLEQNLENYSTLAINQVL